MHFFNVRKEKFVESHKNTHFLLILTRFHSSGMKKMMENFRATMPIPSLDKVEGFCSGFEAQASKKKEFKRRKQEDFKSYETRT